MSLIVGRDLTKYQEEQQDYVDGSIHELLLEILPGVYTEWDIEKISHVREAITDNECVSLTEEQDFEFYPWIDEDARNQYGGVG